MPETLEQAAARYVENGWPDRINSHTGQRVEYCPRCGSEAVSVIALACGCHEAFCNECSTSPGRYFGWLIRDAGCGR